MFPIRDENPSLSAPWITLSIIALNVFVWALVEGFGEPGPLASALCEYGLIPSDLLGHMGDNPSIDLGEGLSCRLPSGSRMTTLISHMFLHGGWFHLIGNLWFLWIFGDNVEDATGRGRFLLFYLLAGLAAAMTQVLSEPSSTAPMVGASGAIGGVMGAYARLFPAARIQTLIIIGFYVSTVYVPALVVLGLWFLIQLLSGLPSLHGAGAGIAFFAHIGGFVSGFLLIPHLSKHKNQENL